MDWVLALLFIIVSEMKGKHLLYVVVLLCYYV